MAGFRPRPDAVVVLLGTAKGLFVAESDRARRRWELHGPFCDSWRVNHAVLDPRDGRTICAGMGSPFFGPMVRRSRDFGATWENVNDGLDYGPDGPKLTQVWHVRPGLPAASGRVWAGVEQAGLFVSDDGGQTWREVAGLRGHPTADRWTPGGGGLMVHSLALDPRDPGRIYAGISAGGVYRTDDGGRSWAPRNRGVRADFLPDPYPEVGQCVHKLLLHPDRPDVLFQQNHCGVYRSDDRGDTWVDISEGLPSRFGFGLALHAHDPETAFVVPLDSDERRWTPGGAMAVWRTRDGGRSWQRCARGLPQEHAYLVVLREGMAVDDCDPCGVYVGTHTGHLFYSRDEGAHWECLVSTLPPILSVEAGSARAGAPVAAG